MVKKKEFWNNQIQGIALILLGLIVYNFRPFQDCSWWNFACHTAAGGTSLLFTGILVIMIIAGVPLILAVLKITKEALDIVEKLWSIRKLETEQEMER